VVSGDILDEVNNMTRFQVNVKGPSHGSQKIHCEYNGSISDGYMTNIWSVKWPLVILRRERGLCLSLRLHHTASTVLQKFCGSRTKSCGVLSAVVLRFVTSETAVYKKSSGSQVIIQNFSSILY
jgi:hypothetical protein